MNRRGFLRSFAAVPIAAVAPAALVELLEPKRTIILPPACGWPSGEFTARYVHKTYALAYVINEESIEDLTDYPNLGRRYAEALASSMRETSLRHRDLLLANVLSSAFGGA